MRAALALPVLLLIGATATAAVTRSFRQTTAKDFEEGEATASMVLPTGDVVPGMKSSPITLDAAFVWCGVLSPDGKIAYFGTGDQGRIYAVETSATGGKARLVTTLEAAWVTALAVRPDGTLVAGTTPGGPRGWRIAAALGAATVVLGGFGVWATLHAASLRSNAAAQNTALTDGPTTAAVRREISAAVNTIFSYNYANTAATRRAAQGLLTGPAVRQYNSLFTLVTRNAPAQKLVVTTRVTNSGVELLNGNRARVLVFANQQDTRAGTGQTSYAGAMFAVTARHQGGRWKIENIDTFSG